MNTCNTCRCNKVCNHDLYGFENCNNYIPTENHMPKTHFDRIKAMSVKELAEKYVEFIMQQENVVKELEQTSATVIETFKINLFRQVVMWLESEVQEDE